MLVGKSLGGWLGEGIGLELEAGIKTMIGKRETGTRKEALVIKTTE